MDLVNSLILRLLAAPFGLSTEDYTIFRLPVAEGLASGNGLYNDPLNYPHMPIYPYISALMLLIFDTNNPTLTGFIIKLPLVVADAFIPVVIYKLSLKHQEKLRIGVLTSVVYALNPVSIAEVYYARWDGLAVLILFISLYFLQENRPILVGIFLSIGFFTKQFPILLFGVALIYWGTELKRTLISILVFAISGALILAAVLIPFDSSINQMREAIFNHPVYKRQEFQGPIGSFVELIRTFYDISDNLWMGVWMIMFGLLVTISLLHYARNRTNDEMWNVVTLQMTLLTIFYYDIHFHFMLWLFPWIIWWELRRGGRPNTFIILSAIYFFRFMEHTLLDQQKLSELALGLTGLSILVRLLTDMKTLNFNTTLGTLSLDSQ